MINRDRLVQTFLDLVRIDSPSGNEDAIAQEVTSRLTRLGATVQEDGFHNLIARLDGIGAPFLLSTHLDTVEPGRGITPVVQGNVIRSDGTTILAGDAKAGLAVILEALQAVVEQPRRRAAVEIVLTRGEESGLIGSQHLDYSKIQARRGVVFDGEGPVSNITISSPSYDWFDVSMFGKAAHAGVEPEKGLSSIKMAAHFIMAFPQGRIDEETTANIGLIQGGAARNSVPAETVLKLDLRSRNKDKLDELSRSVEQIASSVRDAFSAGRVEVRGEHGYRGYQLTPSNPTIAWLCDTLRRLELTPGFRPSGGGSDSNNFHEHGIEAITVGFGGEYFHTVEETINIHETADAAKFCEALLLEVE